MFDAAFAFWLLCLNELILSLNVRAKKSATAMILSLVSNKLLGIFAMSLLITTLILDGGAYGSTCI